MSVKNLDVHPRYVSALLNARIHDVKKLLCFSKLELVKKTGLGENAVKGIFDAAGKSVCTTPWTNVWDIVNETAHPVYQHFKIPTCCRLLDEQLRGGIVYPGVTEICGESGSGKTQLCIHLCLTAQIGVEHHEGSGPGALYICTEDPFPTKRLYQMAGEFSKLNKPVSGNGKPSKLTDQIYIEHCVDLEDLWALLDVRIHALLSKTNIKLIVIDSVAALFRSEYDLSELQERAKMLAKFGRLLHDISFKNKLCVLCVNQVSDVFDDVNFNMNNSDGSRHVTPALGLTWSYFVNTRLMISRTQWKTCMFPSSSNNHKQVVAPYDVVIRSLKVIFSSHLPSSKSYFVVDKEGIKDFQFPEDFN